MRKIKSIKRIESFDIYDITVEDDHCFELENGVIAHNSMYPKDILSGGTGIMYSSDAVWIIGRRQNKNSAKEVTGYDFTIKIEKSRFVKEGRSIPISVSWDQGIHKNSGLLEVAMVGGFVSKVKKGKYQGVNPETGEILHDKEYTEKGTIKDEFWDVIFENTNFKGFIEDYYKLNTPNLDTEIETKFEKILEEEFIDD